MDIKLSEREIQKAKKTFRDMDVDGDGTVSLEDFETYLLKKKQNAFYMQLNQKRKFFLGALRQLGRDKSSGEDDDDLSSTPQKNSKSKKRKKKSAPKKPQKQLTEDEQQELAKLDPFASGHTESEKERMWTRINELVGNETIDEDTDDDVEHVSFSGSENENSTNSTADSSTSAPSTDKIERKNRAIREPRKSLSQSRGAKTSVEPSLSGLKRSLTHRKKDKEKEGSDSPATSRTHRESRDSDEGTTPTKSDSTVRENSEIAETSTPRKTINDGLKKSASAISNVSKRGTKVMASVLKKAEEGAKMAKTKILKEEVEEDPVADPDDPALFAAAYKKKQ